MSKRRPRSTIVREALASPEATHLRKVHGDDPRQLGRELKELKRSSLLDAKRALPLPDRMEVRRLKVEHERRRWENKRRDARRKKIKELRALLRIDEPIPLGAVPVRSTRVSRVYASKAQNLRSLLRLDGQLDGVVNKVLRPAAEALGFKVDTLAILHHLEDEGQGRAGASFGDVVLTSPHGDKTLLLGFLLPRGKPYLETLASLHRDKKTCRYVHVLPVGDNRAALEILEKAARPKTDVPPAGDALDGPGSAGVTQPPGGMGVVETPAAALPDVAAFTGPAAATSENPLAGIFRGGGVRPPASVVGSTSRPRPYPTVAVDDPHRNCPGRKPHASGGIGERRGVRRNLTIQGWLDEVRRFHALRKIEEPEETPLTNRWFQRVRLTLERVVGRLTGWTKSPTAKRLLRELREVEERILNHLSEALHETWRKLRKKGKSRKAERLLRTLLGKHSTIVSRKFLEAPV